MTYYKITGMFCSFALFFAFFLIRIGWRSVLLELFELILGVLVFLF